MSTYTDGCLVKTLTKRSDIKASDFRVVATAVAASGNYNVTVKITPFKNKGDVKSITQATGVNIFNNEQAGSPSIIVSGVSNTDTPGALTVVFNGVPAPTTTNRWKVVYNNLIVVGKAGNTLTGLTLTVTFPSPV